MCKVSLNHESAPVLMRQPFTVHPSLDASAPIGGCSLAGDGPVLDVIYGLSQSFVFSIRNCSQAR